VSQSSQDDIQVTKSHDASRYREDAARFRQRAADAADDADLRNSYLAAAREFEKLADLLEAKLRPPSAAKSAATRGTWLSMSRLPRRQQGRDTADNLPEPERTTDSNHPCAARMVTVLVIDADPAVRLAVKSVLEPADLTVIAVAEAAAALERLAVLRVDLIICDVAASTPDGKPATSAIADIDPSAPIMTLVPKHRDAVGMSACIGNALEKPFTPSELLRKVRRALVAPVPPSSQP
jgi:CheY-like chemotaxis protein